MYDRAGVTRVLLALADVGLGIPTQEGLERLGRDVRWSAAHAAGPDATLTPLPDVVVVDADGAVLVPAALLDHVVAAAPEQERMEAWIMTEVGRGTPLPGLYPMNAETRARYEAER